MKEPSILDKIEWLIAKGVKITWGKYNTNIIWVCPNPGLTFYSVTKPTTILLYTNRPLEEALVVVDDAVQRMIEYDAYMENQQDDPLMLALQEAVLEMQGNG